MEKMKTLTIQGTIFEVVDEQARADIAELQSSGGNADYAQNDPTAADYIKNRPFWTDDPVETVLIEEQTLTVGDDLYDEVDGVVELVVGETYTVIFNGTPYECVAWQADGIEYDAVMLGNGSVYGGTGGNGEPFSLDMGKDGLFLNVAEAGTYTLSVLGMAGEIHKIDEKYIPKEFLSFDEVFGVSIDDIEDGYTRVCSTEKHRNLLRQLQTARGIYTPFEYLTINTQNNVAWLLNGIRVNSSYDARIVSVSIAFDEDAQTLQMSLSLGELALA